MNVSHLPNELLVNIVGRLDFDSVHSIFLLNKNFNNLVKVHRLYKPIAEELCVCVRKSHKLFTLTVEAKLPPKWSLGPKSEWKYRKKTEKVKVYGNKQLEERLLPMIKKLAISSTKGLNIYQKSVDWNIMDVIQEARISMNLVENIRTASYIDTSFITDEHIKRIVSRKPKSIEFSKCTTGIKFQNLLTYIEQMFVHMKRGRWHFGVVPMTGVEYQQLEELINNLRQTNAQLVRHHRFSTSRQYFSHCLKNKDKKWIYWDEKVEP